MLRAHDVATILASSATIRMAVLIFALFVENSVKIWLRPICLLRLL